jgi:hypothetical protein
MKGMRPMMIHSQVQLATKPQSVSNPFTRSLRVVHGTVSKVRPYAAWGIDPGVNFGLTVIQGDKVAVFHGALLQGDQPGWYGLLAYKFLTFMMTEYQPRHGLMIIEGAAYGAPFRQVELSEIRTAFYLAARHYGGFSDVLMKAPRNIRKEVFGDGKVQAGDEWPLLNHNAADSLSMALYAAQYVEA